ncbi:MULTISPECIES: nuclear transport factor 2 family protein [unclassified Mucilaginibacter]|uniref:nuclear transport factor 2 family protein n=1 Tax=unclassified Mucilaginibacter TaxID=2617802 RepID=UPI0031F6D63A
MKTTLKTIVLGLALLVVTSVVKADEPVAAKLTKNHAITTYVNAMTQGKNAGLKDVIDQTAKFSTLRGKQVVSFDKADMLKFADQNKDIQQACTTTTTEVETNADMSVVKVDMKYENFTRTNYVTMANTGDGWKITNVYSVFK